MEVIFDESIPYIITQQLLDEWRTILRLLIGEDLKMTIGNIPSV